MSPPVCPECQKSVPASAPAGQCPECLLKRGLERPGFASAAFAVTTPQGRKQAQLTAEFVARHFPQMEAVEFLGQGGMGTVFKAKQAKLDRNVAIKIIRPEAADDPAFTERFMREARTLARLSHPNIVMVHDFGEIDLSRQPSVEQSDPRGTLYYFVMEYVDGANLRQLMQAGQLSESFTLSIIQQACDALQYAHEEGVVHRDIKPENIMLDAKGRVKIADFGLAKLAEGSGDDWTLTGTHQVMGTPRYMAPEQMTGSRLVDHRADIYSLAVVFYEMLTGTIPIGHFAAPSKKVRVDARVDEIIFRAMASEPDQRFASVRDLQSCVDRLVSSPGEHGRSASPDLHGHGVSTIIDRQVAGTWQLLSGRVPEEGLNSGTYPFLLVSIMSLAGIGSLVLGWQETGDVHTEIQAVAITLFTIFCLSRAAIPDSIRCTTPDFGGTTILGCILSLVTVLGLQNTERSSDARYWIIPCLSSVLMLLLGVTGLRHVLSRTLRSTRQVPRLDSVTLTQSEIESGLLPDLCMICGAPALGCVSKQIEHRPRWAEAASFGGFMLGGIPGIIVQMMTTHKLQVPCPVCEQHQKHWHTRNIYAATGWLLIPLLSGIGVLISLSGITEGEGKKAAIISILSMLGLVTYLLPVIYMSWNVVKIESIGAGEPRSIRISLHRVCSAFASEVRRRQLKKTSAPT